MGRIFFLIPFVLPAVGCYQMASLDEGDGSGQASSPSTEACDCLGAYEDDYYASGNLSVIEDAVTACFTLSDPVEMTREAGCLPFVFVDGVGENPDVEVALQCIGFCDQTGFVVARYDDVDAEGCREYSNAISYETEGLYLGCVPYALADLMPIS